MKDMSNKINSPYSAAMTGCGFMWEEMTNVLPLLMSDDSEALLKQEIIDNNYLMMRTEQTRKRAVAEFVKRYKAVPMYFWKSYQGFSKEAKIVAMYFVNLKCYKLFYDLHLILF